jgi:glucose-6-phosphate-specific signal transduction histidine kinase
LYVIIILYYTQLDLWITANFLVKEPKLARRYLVLPQLISAIHQLSIRRSTHIYLVLKMFLFLFWPGRREGQRVGVAWEDD